MPDLRKYADRREYIKSAVTKRRKLAKIRAVNYLGGKCQRCGYCKCIAALEFHHTDPASKSFGISYRGLCRSFEKLRVELDKCELLCANCHRETVEK